MNGWPLAAAAAAAAAATQPSRAPTESIMEGVTPMTSKPECVFCRREESSNEHVFARWLSRLLADGAPFTLNKTPGRSTSGLQTINVKSRAACRSCNGGWMSRSESDAKVLLPHVIRGETIQWDATQQALAARWVFKTALMLDRSSLASRVAPAHHFSFLFEQQSPPESVTIYLARYFPEAGEEHVGVIGSSYRPTGIDPHVYPDPYQITFSVGQAVFQAFGHSGMTQIEVHRAGYRDSGLVVPVVDVFRQLWPIRTANFEWPPAGGHLGTHNLQVLARF
jgi:hypothetical protein